MSRRKKYYHKTIVLKDIFSNTIIYTAVVVFAVGLLVSLLSKTEITVSNAYLVSSLNSILCRDDTDIFKMNNIYDCFTYAIPSIKSSEEMTKKYSALYSGVKKENAASDNKSALTNEIDIKAMDMSAGGITFRNETAYTINADELLNKQIDFGDNPAVLIIHTHTSEAYADSPGARSLDNNKNVVMVGEVIGESLKSSGVNVIHDTIRNDYPSYNGSYSKALSNITKNIEKNPEIQVVLDVHRDYAEQEKDGVKVQLKPVAKINGKDVAQVMFVVGTDGNGLVHPNWRDNLAFAVQVQNELNQISPKIARPVNLRRERFNQHLTNGSVIIEMGTAGNTVEECKNAAKLVGDAIAKVLLKQ